MNEVKNLDREVLLRKQNTGGRGTDEIQSYVHSLLSRYANQKKAFTPPIDPSVLAELQNARIIYRQGSKNWIASLMPMGSGFVINVNESCPTNRKRNAICHEIAHTFFFDTKTEPPRRLKNSQPDDQEERLCFWAAREMLVPASLFKSELRRLGGKTIYSFESISELAEIFKVSPGIIALRLTHDLALLGDDWLILWSSSARTGEEVRPKSLYPKHISTSISNYRKSKIIEAIRSVVSECQDRENPIEMEISVEKKKIFRFKVKTEKVKGYRLCAISWVSPLSGLNPNT